MRLRPTKAESVTSRNFKADFLNRTWPMDEPAIAGVVLAAADRFRHRVTRMD